MKTRVVIVTNIPAPYSTDLFHSLMLNNSSLEFYFVYSALSSSQRKWSANVEKLDNVYSFNSYCLKKKDSLYNRDIYIPSNVFRVLNSINPDVLIVYEYSIASILSLLWARFHHKKFIHATEGTMLSEKNCSFFQIMARKFILKFSDYNIACSSKSKEKLINYGVSEEKISTVILTSDIDRYLSYTKETEYRDSIRLLYVGKIEYRKGIDLLINCLPYVSSNKNIELLLVGDGTCENIRTLECSIRSLNLDNIKVSFIDFLQGDDLVRIYKSSDIFVFPSRNDCYGMVLVEAFCCGLPIVSSKYADGAYDIIQDGVNGRIADPYNAVEFGAAISDVINNDKYFKNALCNDFSKFDITKESEGYIESVKKVLI